MSKTRKRSTRASGYVYKFPKSIKAYCGGRTQKNSIDDEYRKADAAPTATNVVFPFVVGDPGTSGSPIFLLGAAVAIGVAHRKNIVSEYGNTTLAIKMDRWFRSKSWDSTDAFTHYLSPFYIDGSREYDRDLFSAMGTSFAAPLALSPLAAYICERFAKQEWALVGPDNFQEEVPSTNWVHETEGILQRLENRATYPDDYEAAVLFAEVKPFRGAQRTRLLNALRTHIDEHRFVEDQDSLVTLCSAIRKYAMNMQESQFEHYANWLLPTETATLHHEAEMEFAKGICWRLEFESHAWPANYPHLTGTLFDLVDSYLTPRLILQKSYANTAMFGIIALHILEAASGSGGALVARLHKKTVDSGVMWFSEMVSDDVDEAIQYISDRDDVLAKEVAKIRQG